MDTGAAIFPTHVAVASAALERLAEEHRYESLFFPARTHAPASREPAWRECLVNGGTVVGSGKEMLSHLRRQMRRRAETFENRTVPAWPGDGELPRRAPARDGGWRSCENGPRP